MSSLTLDSALPFPSQISTSGNGVLQHMRRLVIPFGGSLVSKSTTATELEAADPELVFAERTNSGLMLSIAVTSHAAAITEIRRRSGLTWDQIARLFGVARRSVHFWISGKALNSANEERLNRLLVAIRYVDRGGAAATRAALMSAEHDAVVPFDLLAEGRFEEVMGRLGQGRAYEATRSASAGSRLRPTLTPSPDRLVGALQDSVHRNLGRTRAAHSVKVKKSQ